MSEDVEVSQPFAGAAVDGVAGAVMATIAGGGAVSALISGLQPFLARAMTLSVREIQSRAQRTNAMWLAAADAAEQDPEELLNLIDGDPDRLHIAHATSEAAGDARYPERIMALGRALATGLLSDDDATLDHEQLVVDALRSLDRPHLVVLWALLEEEDALDDWRQLTLSWKELQERVPGYTPASVTRIVAALNREGLLDTPALATAAPDGDRPDELHAGQFLAVSDFGVDVLRRLFEVGLRRKS